MKIAKHVQQFLGIKGLLESPNDLYSFKFEDPPEPLDNRDDMFIIGAGPARTGTSSLQAALCSIGYKCYHAREMLNNINPDLKIINEAAQIKRKKMDELGIKTYKNNWDKCTIDFEWNRLFRQNKDRAFMATVDSPLHWYYLDLLKYYPNSKVILTVRDDSDKWYQSAISTVYKIRAIINKIWCIKLRGLVLGGFNKNDPMQIDTCYPDKYNDEKFCKQQYEDWIEEVKRTVPKEKLLVFNVKDGWDPILEFLGEDKPNGQHQFPHWNERKEWKQLISRLNNIASVINFVTLIVLAILLYVILTITGFY